MGLWNKLSQFLTAGGGASDHATLEKVQQLLVEADFGVAATNETVERLSKARRVDQAALEQIVVEQLGVDEADVKPEASFVDDLNADSLDLVELVMSLEEEFGTEISDEDAEGIRTVQDAVDYIDEHSAQ